ncbi:MULTISPECIES: hypothetical protein [unclassified Synechocystis]|uniref:hypothetical protein n=1 Tax=unclassified Synechocystis TaxID=2640012 RepID=UPI0004259623|nr:MULTISPECIES: hypothetical protein [unclassified Synechocystis]AIE73105.1 hypothetical protein D082_05760 [Synechocystis sp. PCC 6714]MCT0254372.1 hypothetical protein [Synechocystis sp. CS-94]
MKIIDLDNNPINHSQKICLNDWDVDQIFTRDYQLPINTFNGGQAQLKDNFCILLSRDVYSEGDAQFLSDYLLSHSQELSPDFLALLPRWLGDEQKHYQALRRVYRCLSGLDFVAMDEDFHRRSPGLKKLKILKKSIKYTPDHLVANRRNSTKVSEKILKKSAKFIIQQQSTNTEKEPIQHHRLGSYRKIIQKL